MNVVGMSLFAKVDPFGLASGGPGLLGFVLRMPLSFLSFAHWLHVLIPSWQAGSLFRRMMDNEV